MKKHLPYIVLILLLIPSTCWGTTYYLRNDGTAANKAAATSCGAVGTAMSVATHNAETFAADDTIVVCPDGGATYTALTFPASGITYDCDIDGDGTQAVITSFAGEIASGNWTDDGDGTYSLATSTYTALFEDELPLVINSDASVSAGEFYWAANVLHYNPTTGTPAGHTLIGANNNAIIASGKSNITVQNCTIKYARNKLVEFSTSGTDILFHNCNLSLAYNDLIGFTDLTNNLEVRYSNLSYGGNGVYVHNSGGTGVHFHHNTVSYMNWADYNPAQDGHAFGIQRTDGAIVEHNTIDHCRVSVAYWTDGTGTINNNITRFNTITDNIGLTSPDSASTGAAIWHLATVDNVMAGNQTYNNIIKGNVVGLAARRDNAGAVNSYWNNILYDNTTNILLDTDAEGFLFKNNISYASSTNKHVDFAASVKAGVTVDYNLYYPDGASKFYWRSATASDNFADWQSDSSQDANSTASDPLFISATDYRLQANSPARGAGTNVSLTTDYLGRTIPANGVYDIGAYQSRESTSFINGMYFHIYGP